MTVIRHKNTLNQRKQRRNICGLTIVEVVFVIAIVGILMTTASLLLRGSYDSWQTGSRRNELIQMARVGLNKITREIRTAHNFGRLSDSTNLYFTDSTGTLKQFEIDIANNVLRFGSVGSSLSDFITPIEAGSSFTYYRDNCLTSAISPCQIRSVLITLVISDSEGLVNNITVTSRAERRMKNFWSRYKKEISGLGITYERLDPNFFVQRWATNNLGCRFDNSPPVVVDNVVYIGCSNDPIVIALDANDGTELWRTNLSQGGDVRSSPIVDGSRVYVAGRNYVYALNILNGTEIGFVTLNGKVDRSSPIIYGDYLYVATKDDEIQKFNKNNGSNVWNASLAGNPDRSSPVIYNNIIYIGAGRLIQGFYVDTGLPVWGGSSGSPSGPIIYVDGSRKDKKGTRLQFKVENTSGSDIVVSSMKLEYSGGFTYSKIRWEKRDVWSGTNSSGDTANFSPTRNLRSGRRAKIRINFSGQINTTEFTVTLNEGQASESIMIIPVDTESARGQLNSSPAVFDGVIYIGDDDDRIYAYDANSGSELWERRLRDRVRGSPAISSDGQYVYFGSGNRVYKRRTSDGSGVWRRRNLDGDVDSAIALSGDYVFAVGGNVLYALNDSNGRIAWQSNALSGDIRCSSIAIVDGSVYIASRNGRIYAFGL